MGLVGAVRDGGDHLMRTHKEGVAIPVPPAIKPFGYPILLLINIIKESAVQDMI